jgi:hypothetical protein
MRQSEYPVHPGSERFQLTVRSLLFVSFIASIPIVQLIDLDQTRLAAYGCAFPFLLLGATTLTARRDSARVFALVAAIAFVVFLIGTISYPLYRRAVVPQSKWSHPLTAFVDTPEGMLLLVASCSLLVAAIYTSIREPIMCKTIDAIDPIRALGIVCCLIAGGNWLHRCEHLTHAYSPFR